MIEPMNGSIEPNSFIELKITLISSFEPSVYEGELECMIIWDSGNIINLFIIPYVYYFVYLGESK